MDVFISYDLGEIENHITIESMQDDLPEIRHTSQNLESVQKMIKSWIESNGGSPIIDLVTKGSFMVSAENALNIQDLQRQIEFLVNSLMLVGIGMSLSESTMALQFAKKNTTDKIVLYTPDLQESLKNDSFTRSLDDKEDLIKDQQESQIINNAENQAGSSAPVSSEQLQNPQEDKQEDVKTIIANALKGIKENAGVLESLKTQAPEAFQAVKDIVQAMIVMAQHMTKSDPDDKDKLSEKDLKNHDKNLNVDSDELEMGIKEEMEHTKDHKIAKQIALDHLKEDSRYYSKLKACFSKDEKLPMPAKTPKKVDYPAIVGVNGTASGQIKDGKIRTEGKDPQTGQSEGPGTSMATSGLVLGPHGRAVSSKKPNEE